MSEPPSKVDYKKTLNLPQTAFPMKADLALKEPQILKEWDGMDLYGSIQKKNAGRPAFVLHDGPPYANGNIHFGHILNKVLKDIIVRYKSMSGHRAPFRPGWDCHGLPIEHEVDRELGSQKRGLDKIAIRRACRDYARKFVEIQKNDFKRLGVLGTWENPYLTMDNRYEAAIAREFGRFAASGSVYRKKKPVLWCAHCQTALAEAEVEYEEEDSPSITVRFPLDADLGEVLPGLKGKKCSLAIWTTTPWTLPANLAVALHPNHDYVALPAGDEMLIVAKNLAAAVTERLGLAPEVPKERFSARNLENRLCRHPFLARSSRIVLSDFVTVDTGTGCVHIAPGHGEEDYNVGLAYGLETLTPVDSRGRFTAECGVPEWIGESVFRANDKVLAKLEETKTLLHSGTLRHTYPHCWRCKKPVLFRATEQWFLSMEEKDHRSKALDAIRRVEWIPAWGRERIYGMVQKRPDWCLSRQRSWGVPILAFRCGSCDRILLDEKVIEKAAVLFEKEGSDCWFREPVERFLNPVPACSGCGARKWVKEEDILDVWFDSGVSWAAVLEPDAALGFPADLYLEGGDQHRGWFQSSLLAAIGTRGQAPFRLVVTHGFVVDGEGRKYSKSARNYIPPDKVLKENGADILRLWVAAEDYTSDIRVSDEIFGRLVDAYRKIRNTCRFLLGNLYDFDPRTMRDAGAPTELDLWARHKLQKLISRIRRAYEGFEFHVIFHELVRFCTVDLSSFYLDILKDRLYTSAPDAPARRASQAVLFDTVAALARLVAPILSFTADEIWSQIPPFEGKGASVHLESLPEPDDRWINEGLARSWDDFLEVRGEILKVLEKARQGKKIGNPLEAKLTLSSEGESASLLQRFGTELPSLLLVSQVEWTDEPSGEATVSARDPSFFIQVEKAEGAKCARCWVWSREVGQANDHPTLCGRCVAVVRGVKP